jgi:3'-phosphoadenosine 5'-phosphosulfate sulfotransferase (PAPS reductase)/FAD synthetase
MAYEPKRKSSNKPIHRTVCHFSCGAASAVAAKIVLEEPNAGQVVLLNAFVKQEHKDNRRFLKDCEKWLGQSITVLHNQKYSSSTYAVWLGKRFIKNRNSAPCSTELKRNLLNTFSLPSDLWVIGYTKDEEDRLDTIREINPGRSIRAPLIEYGLSKQDCLAIVERAGIVLPLMYRMGYDNANCIGCPKGGQNYWQKIRRDFPAQFVQIQSIQENIGPGSNFLQFRSGPRKGERMSLAELPEGDGNLADEPTISCSFLCEAAPVGAC